MNPEEDLNKAVDLYATKPFPAFIVTILLIFGLVYYFIVRTQLQDVITERDNCRIENKQLYDLIVKSRDIIDRQNGIIESEQFKNPKPQKNDK